MPACADDQSVSRLGSVSPPSPGPVWSPQLPRVGFKASASSSAAEARRPLSPLPVRALGWIVHFVLHAARTLATLACNQLLLFWPGVWVAAALWLLRRLLSWRRRGGGRRRRAVVMVSSGSTVQTLLLARNLHASGVDVVAVELDGLFPLARFSSAVRSFHSVPSPAAGDEEASRRYVRALCDVAAREGVSVYVPVSATSTAYYDALAKPHLEALGVGVFGPGAREVWLLDDVREVLRRAADAGLYAAPHYPVARRDDVLRLYEAGVPAAGRHFMASVGTLGCRDRVRLVLPARRADFRMPYEMSQRRPWVVVRDPPGRHYVTCTTLRDAVVVANVTCLVTDDGALRPVQHQGVDVWLSAFFARQRVLGHVTGHVAFRFVEVEGSGELTVLSSRVGVSLAYVCQSAEQARLLWSPCRHAAARLRASGRFWLPPPPALAPGNGSGGGGGSVVDAVGRREALFCAWDPLPYLAYYHLKLPLRSVRNLLRNAAPLRGCPLPHTH